MVLRVPTTGDYNPATSTAAAPTNDYAFKGFIRDPARNELSDMVLRGDRFVIIATVDLVGIRRLNSQQVDDVTPAPGQQVVIDSQPWRVLDARATYSGEQTAIFELHIRQ